MGASGAIYSVMSFFACVSPQTKFYIFFVLPLPAWAAVGGVFLWDGITNGILSATNSVSLYLSPLMGIISCMDADTWDTRIQGWVQQDTWEAYWLAQLFIL